MSTDNFDVVDGWRAEAIADYEANGSDEINLQEGDMINVTERCPNGWWIGVNRRGQKKGIFPGSYVEVRGVMKIKVPREAAVEESPFENPAQFEAEMDKAFARVQEPGETQPQPTSQHQQLQLNQEIWFWGALDREEAVRMLAGKPEGTFLVRQSQTDANSYSISVTQSGIARHVRVQNIRGGYAINPQDPPESSIQALIAKKRGERLKSTLQGTQTSVETQLLVSPFPNPANAQYNQQQAPAVSTPQPQFQPPAVTVVPEVVVPEVVATAAPATVKQTPPTNQYARKRGGAANVAQSSQIKAVDSALRDQSRVLKVAPPAVAVSTPPQATPAAVDPFATPTLPQPTPPSQLVQPVQAAPAAAPAMDFLTTMRTLWSRCRPDAENRLDGAQLRPIMMQSKLDMTTLGTIWSMVDTTSTGLIDYKQFGFMLGLISQHQQSLPLDIASVSPSMKAPQMGL